MGRAMSYDNWKATNPADAEFGPEPPPCEIFYGPGRVHLHPRYPSGACTVCGAAPTQGCQWDGWLEWERFQRDDPEWKPEKGE